MKHAQTMHTDRANLQQFHKLTSRASLDVLAARFRHRSGAMGRGGRWPSLTEPPGAPSTICRSVAPAGPKSARAALDASSALMFRKSPPELGPQLHLHLRLQLRLLSLPPPPQGLPFPGRQHRRHPAQPQYGETNGATSSSGRRGHPLKSLKTRSAQRSVHWHHLTGQLR